MTHKKRVIHMNKINNCMANLWKLFIANISFILVIASLACITYAGFLFTPIAGFIILGISLFILAWILQPDERG